MVLDQQEQDDSDAFGAVLRNNWVLIVDRFEGDYALCEVSSCDKIIKIPKNNLPVGVAESDVLKLDPLGRKLVIDVAITAQRRKESLAKLEGLLKSGSPTS